MRCTNPAWIHPSGHLGREVACGHCKACRIARSREWTLRMLHELVDWPVACYATLTYEDAELPGDYGLCKEDLQSAIKRLRARIAPRRMRYFACGEYGETYGRPHYHAILFGIEPYKEKRLLLEAWGKGFVKVGTVTPASVRYVTDYIMKAQFGPEFYQGRPSPFQIRSKGLGREFCDRHQDQLRENLGTSINGKPIGLPRYYFKRLGLSTSDAEVFQRSLSSTLESWRVYQERARENHTDVWEEKARGLRQAALNIDAREALRKRLGS